MKMVPFARRAAGQQSLMSWFGDSILKRWVKFWKCIRDGASLRQARAIESPALEKNWAIVMQSFLTQDELRLYKKQMVLREQLRALWLRPGDVFIRRRIRSGRRILISSIGRLWRKWHPLCMKSK